MNISIIVMIQGCLKIDTSMFYGYILLLFHHHSHQVLQVARNYFGCRDLPFVPLENGDSVTR